MLYNDYCSEHYNNLYATNFPIFLNGKTSKNAITKAEQSAQRIAIKDTLKDALENIPIKLKPQKSGEPYMSLILNENLD